MRHLVREAGLGERVLIDSAGTGDWHVGEPRDRRSTEVGRRRGMPLSGRARQFVARRLRPLRLRAGHGPAEPGQPAQAGARRRRPGQDAAAARVRAPRPPTGASRPTTRCPIPITAGPRASTRCSTSAWRPAGACWRTCGRPHGAGASMARTGGACARQAVAQALGVAVERGACRWRAATSTGLRPGAGRRAHASSPRPTRDAPAGMFWAEARGLAWLAEAGALRMPAVLAVGERRRAPSFLVLEHIRQAPRRRDFDEQPGPRPGGAAPVRRARLRARPRQLHRPAAPAPTSPQPRPGPSFYRSAPAASRSCSGRSSAGWPRRRMRRGPRTVCATLDELVGPARAAGAAARRSVGRQPAWSTRPGGPCLIDPAVYGGHREVDLAMMRLFGGFSAARLRRLPRGLPPGPRPRGARAPLPALPAAGAREPVRPRLRLLGRGGPRPAHVSMPVPGPVRVPDPCRRGARGTRPARSPADGRGRTAWRVADGSGSWDTGRVVLKQGERRCGREVRRSGRGSERRRPRNRPPLPSRERVGVRSGDTPRVRARVRGARWA